MRQLRSPRSPAAPAIEPAELRPLGALENIMTAYAETASTTFTVVAEIEGEINAGEAETALAAVQARHPLLNVGIRRNADGRRCFVRGAGPILLDVLRPGAATWEDVAGLEIRRRFDVENGPLLQVALLPEAKGTRLFFTFHHGMSDGKSAVFVIRDFLQALNGQGLDPFLDADPIDQRLAALVEPRRMEAAQDGASRQPAEVPAENRWGRGMDRRPIVTARTVAPTLARRLREVSRFHDTTVHAALSVAVARAVGALKGTDDPVRILSPVDQRAAMGTEDECGFFASVGKSAPAPNGNAFWEEARAARAALEPFLGTDAAQGMIAAMAAHSAADDSPEGACRFFGAFDFDVLLTNLGVLPIAAKYGRHRIKSITGPIVLASAEGEQVIGVGTWKAGCSWSTPPSIRWRACWNWSKASSRRPARRGDAAGAPA